MKSITKSDGDIACNCYDRCLMFNRWFVHGQTGVGVSSF